MDPILQKLLASGIRWGATAAATWLLQHNIILPADQSSTVAELVSALTLAGTLGWSFWEKYGHAQVLKVLTKYQQAYAPPPGVAPPKSLSK